MIRTANRFLKGVIIPLFTFFMIGNSSYAQTEKPSSESSNALLEERISRYDENVIGISTNGIIKGRNAMKAYLGRLSKEQGPILGYKTHYKVPVYQVLEYEIGLSQTEKGKENAHLIIWSKEKGLKKRIVEIVYEMSGDLKVPSELAKARKKWVKLCNKHNSKNLVQELYTPDAIYYNRGRILRGHAQLTQEYAYMNDPSYFLRLNPKHIEVVSENLIYEIGQCSGSYPLPYILVWKKQPEGDWKISLDSNY